MYGKYGSIHLSTYDFSDTRIPLYTSISLDFLKYITNHHFIWYNACSISQATFGNTDVISYLFEHKIHVCIDTIIQAIRHNHLDIVKLCVQHHMPLDTYVIAESCRQNNLQILTYLHHHHCPIDDKCIELAAEYNAIDCIQYCLQHGFPYSVNTIIDAIIHNDAVLSLQYFIEHDIIHFHDILWNKFTHYSSVSCLTYLLNTYIHDYKQDISTIFHNINIFALNVSIIECLLEHNLCIDIQHISNISQLSLFKHAIHKLITTTSTIYLTRDFWSFNFNNEQFDFLVRSFYHNLNNTLKFIVFQEIVSRCILYPAMFDLLVWLIKHDLVPKDITYTKFVFIDGINDVFRLLIQQQFPFSVDIIYNSMGMFTNDLYNKLIYIFDNKLVNFDKQFVEYLLFNHGFHFIKTYFDSFPKDVQSFILDTIHHNQTDVIIQYDIEISDFEWIKSHDIPFHLISIKHYLKYVEKKLTLFNENIILYLYQYLWDNSKLTDEVTCLFIKLFHKSKHIPEWIFSHIDIHSISIFRFLLRHMICFELLDVFLQHHKITHKELELFINKQFRSSRRMNRNNTITTIFKQHFDHNDIYNLTKISILYDNIQYFKILQQQQSIHQLTQYLPLIDKYKSFNILHHLTISSWITDNVPDFQNSMFNTVSTTDICLIDRTTPRFYVCCNNPYKHHIVNIEYYYKLESQCPLCKHDFQKIIYFNHT